MVGFLVLRSTVVAGEQDVAAVGPSACRLPCPAGAGGVLARFRPRPGTLGTWYKVQTTPILKLQ